MTTKHFELSSAFFSAFPISEWVVDFDAKIKINHDIYKCQNFFNKILFWMLKHFLSPKSIFTFFVKFGIIVSFFFICPQFSFFSCFQLSRLQLIKKETLTLVFSCEFCEFFKNMFIIEQFWWLLLCPVFCSKCIETSIKRKWKHWHEGVSEQKVFT